MRKKAVARSASPARAVQGKSPAETCVGFEETLDISRAADLQTRLSHVLAARNPVILDASDIEHADTAALQVLCAFMHDASAKKIPVSWRQPSESFCNAARLLGLSEFLGLQYARCD